MFKELHDIASKGNVVALAIGAITGAAFGAIVSSLVDVVIMPVVGSSLGQIDFSNLFVVVSNPNSVPMTALAVVALAALNIGLFTNAVVKFIIVAFVLFLVVQGINAIRNKQAAASSA